MTRENGHVPDRKTCDSEYPVSRAVGDCHTVYRACFKYRCITIQRAPKKATSIIIRADSKDSHRDQIYRLRPRPQPLLLHQRFQTLVQSRVRNPSVNWTRNLLLRMQDISYRVDDYSRRSNGPGTQRSQVALPRRNDGYWYQG